jgi:carbon storage regulator
MLVLTRRSGESIVIGGEIRIRVLRASGSRVRLGIEAPADVRIVREKAEEADRPLDALPPRRPHVLRDGVTRNVAASQRAGREAVPAPRQPAAADRHTTLE